MMEYEQITLEQYMEIKLHAELPGLKLTERARELVEQHGLEVHMTKSGTYVLLDQAGYKLNKCFHASDVNDMISDSFASGKEQSE